VTIWPPGGQTIDFRSFRSTIRIVTAIAALQSNKVYLPRAPNGLSRALLLRKINATR